MKAPSKVTAFSQSSNNIMCNNVQQIQVSFSDFQANIQRLHCLFLIKYLLIDLFLSAIPSDTTFTTDLSQLVPINMNRNLYVYCIRMCLVAFLHPYNASFSLSPKLKAT